MTSTEFTERPVEQTSVPRKPFHRRTDYLVSALIVIVVLVAGVALWRVSDVRATGDQTATETLPIATPLTTVPSGFTEAWRAASAATPVPVLAGAAVVTGDGREVLGRDGQTGRVAWRYARNIDLCTVSVGWGDAVAVYRKKDNCSEVTQLAGDTGKRGPQRCRLSIFGFDDKEIRLTKYQRKCAVLVVLAPGIGVLGRFYRGGIAVKAPRSWRKLLNEFVGATHKRHYLRRNRQTVHIER